VGEVATRSASGGPTSPTAKYFVAVEPPAAMRRGLRRVMTELGDRAPVPHITVRDPRGLTRDLWWLSKCRRVATATPNVTMAFGPVRTFERRILYLAVHSEGLNSLHDALASAVPTSPESATATATQFVPHVTLGRFSSVDHELVARAQSLVDQFVPTAPICATEIVVYRRVGDEPYRPWRRLSLRRPSLTDR
jgi:2'-5' RNA ligase